MGIRKRESKKAKNKYVYEADFYYLENGTKKRMTKSGFKTKKEAQEFIAVKQAELLETGKVFKDCRKTLNEVMDEFLEVGSTQYQANTIYNTKKDCRYFKDNLGKMPISQIDYKTLQTFFNQRINEGIESNKNIRKTLKRAFVYAVRVGYIRSNPINEVVVKGVDLCKEKKILKQSDYERLIRVLEDRNEFRYDSYVAAIKIGYYTGLRVSEVLALNKSDFDFENDEINVGKKLVFKGLRKEEYYATKEMKSKKSKAILPLPEVLKEEMIEWFKKNPYERVVVDKQGNYINPTCLSNEVKKIAKKMNIHFNFHMLRHTYATTLIINDVDIKTAQELMRHSNFNTTLSLYTHIGVERKKKVVNEIFKKKSGEKVANLD